MAEFASSFFSTKLHANVKGVSARGGASMVETNDHLIIFGGADREPCHFQDMVVYRPATGSKFESLKVKSENIPMPRSGHAVAPYGKYMFLFGGLDYPEEAVYNDLYLFSTENMEWYYVGEAGIEVPARSSHSLGIVSGAIASGEKKHYLVIYGGAAPEPGLFSDTIYAEIPADPNSIDPETFSVEWKSLSALPGPGERESHASCVSSEGHLYISGGKTGTEVPTLLQDVWRLSVSAAASEGEGAPLVWECLRGLQLPEPRCVHGMCAGGNSLYIFGGFTGEMPGDLLTADLSAAGGDGTARAWQSISVGPEGRVGLSMCAVSPALVQRLTSSNIYSPLFRNQSTTESSDTNIMIFGGSTMEKDLGDIWLLRKKPV